MRRSLSLSVESFKDLALNNNNNNNNKKSVLVCCIRECFGYGPSHALRDGSLLIDTRMFENRIVIMTGACGTVRHHVGMTCPK